MKKKPRQTAQVAPKFLQLATRKWVDEILITYVLESHHVKLLIMAGQAWDRAEQARQAIAKHGMVYLDRFKQPAIRPEVAAERNSMIVFSRLVRELGLDIEPPASARPPRIMGA